MTPRETFVNALKRKGAGRIPRELELSEEKIRELAQKTGTTDYEEYFGSEMRWARTGYYTPVVDYEKLIGKYGSEITRIDAWGVGYIKPTDSQYHFEKKIHPLCGNIGLKDIETYPYPIIRSDITQNLSTTVKEIHSKGYAAISHICPNGGLLYAAIALRGMEEMLLDMASDDLLADALLEKIFEHTCELAVSVTSAGSDMIYLGDDYGTQRGLMISKGMFEKYFEKRIRKIVDICKSINQQVLFAYHSDGNIFEIIPDFINCGVDVLNPVQPECMDPHEIKKEFGGDISLWGTIGTQTVLPFGTAKDVEENVKDIMETVGKGGGLMVAPSHMIEPEVPWENILAFISAIEKYGGYDT